MLQDNQDRIVAVSPHIIDRDQAPCGTSRSRAANANDGTLGYGARVAGPRVTRPSKHIQTFRLSKSIKIKGTGREGILSSHPDCRVRAESRFVCTVVPFFLLVLSLVDVP